MFRTRISFYALLLSTILAYVFTPDAKAQITVNEIGVAAGVGSDNYDSVTRHGLGLNWIDYDNDGFPDLFAPNGAGLPAHLFHNEGDGTFTNQDALLPSGTFEMTGSVFADYDNDGDMDIYITVAGDVLQEPDGGANMLLQNQWVENGNQLSTPLFIDVAATAGVDNLPATPFGAEPGYMSFTAGWTDYDRDSCIDLFVGTMVWDDGGMETTANTLYQNNCDGTFTDVTASSGVNPGNTDWYRPTLAFFGGLLDPNDFDPDLYVINVHDGDPYHIDQLFSNNGDGTFSDIVPTMPGIGDDSGAGMGIDVADIDLDGDWDIYMSDLTDPGNEPVAEGNPLYLGNPDGTWNENSAIAAGVESNNSWGVNFVDLDQDGYEDLQVATIGTGSNNMLYRNQQNGTFDDISVSAGMVDGSEARGSAVADFDRDGDMDFAVVNILGNIFLYENVTVGSGNWVQLDLEAVTSNRAAIGTHVQLTAGGLTQMRQVKGGSSAHSQDDMIVHFGLDAATNIDEIVITWPSGIVQTLTNVGVNQLLTVTEDASGNQPPTASFSFTVTDLLVDFDGSGSTDDGTVVSWDWDFGDGNVASGQTLSHTYAAAGTYTVSLMVTDDEGATGSTSQSVTVSDGSNQDPVASFTFSATDLLVDFDGSGSTDDGLIVSWDWDFGDGNTGAGETSSHTYAAAGTYTVELTVTDDLGATGTTSQSVTVTDGGGASTMHVESISDAALVRNGGTGTAEVIVTVHDESGSPVADATVSGVFSADVTGAPSAVTDANGEAVLVSDEFSTRPGSIVLCVDDVTHASLSYDAAQNTDPGFACEPAPGGNPTASFTYVVTDFTVDLTDTSSDDGTIVSWDWDFGDGNTSTDQNPGHTYADFGTYTVTLTVTDDEALTGTVSQSVTISDPNAVGAFLESGGMVVMEAENFHSSIDRGGDSWITGTANAGFSGASYMVTDPDDGTQIKNDPETESPEMSYDIEFVTTGDYYIWGRMWAPNAKGNTIYTGFDGEAIISGGGFQTAVTSSWEWVQVTKSGNVETLNVASTGAHTFQLWMREDGAAIDKVVLTTDVDFTPDGEGPDESPRATAGQNAGFRSDQLVFSDEFEMVKEALPEHFALEGNYPNPFNPTTTVRFALPENAVVRLAVFDILGRQVARLVSGELSAGWHDVQWDGRSDGGAIVSNGVYFVRLQTGAFNAVHAMVFGK